MYRNTHKQDCLKTNSKTNALGFIIIVIIICQFIKCLRPWLQRCCHKDLSRPRTQSRAPQDHMLMSTELTTVTCPDQEHSLEHHKITCSCQPNWLTWLVQTKNTVSSTTRSHAHAQPTVTMTTTLVTQYSMEKLDQSIDIYTVFRKKTLLFFA